LDHYHGAKKLVIIAEGAIGDELIDAKARYDR
jgi:hypothetical protein